MPKCSALRSERALALYLFCSAAAVRITLTTLNLSGIHAIPISATAQLELYNDFQGYYLVWLHSLASGLLPYRDFFYQYPPLFLYGLYPLYYLADGYGAAFGIVFADSGSAVLVYLLVKEASSRRTALLAGIGYGANPFALLYEGYLMFSIQPMLFFLLLTVFFLRRDMLMSSAISLGVAILLKQEAIFLLPPILPFLRRFAYARVAKAAFVVVGLLFVVSVPFLVAAPSQYFDALTYRPVSYFPGHVNSSLPSQLTSTCLLSQNLTLVVETCALGTLTTIIRASVPPSVQTIIILNAVSRWILVPVALLVLPALYTFRRSGAFLALASAYSFALGVMVVAYLSSYVPLEQVARYPYLPAYALLLIATRNWKGVAAAVGFATASLIIPPGIIQLILPYLAILGVMTTVDEGPSERPHSAVVATPL